jgi:hypothetical protein
MRNTRIVSALIALCLAVALPLVSLSGTAQAKAGHSAVAVSAKAKTKVTINFAANGGKSFRLYGKVKPKAKGKKAVLLRSTTANGKFKTFKTTKTDKQGKYAFSGLKKEGYYAVKIGNGVSSVKHIVKN